jgi:exopolysaccharide biosynthesis polyprenyl glycosylphosphotransferase
MKTEDALNTQISPIPVLALDQRPRAKTIKQDVTIFFVAGDLMLVFASALVATLVRFPIASGNWASLHNSRLLTHFGFLILYAAFLTLFCHVYKAYDLKEHRSARHEQMALLKAITMAALFVTAVIYLSGARSISREVVVETVLLSAVAMMAWRFLRWRSVIDGLHHRNVVIVGAGRLARDLESHLSRNQYLGLAVKGFLDRRQNLASSYDPERRTAGNDTNRLGSIQDLPRIIRSNFIDEIFITARENRDLVKHLIFEARRQGIDARVVPDLYDDLGSSAPIEYLGHIPLMSFCHRSVPTVGLLMKRFIDITLALAALILLSPLLAIVAILVKLTSSGPILYRSVRIGKKGRDFRCYKFRTMSKNAEELRDSLHHLNEREEILFKIANDPRITRLGKFLRKFSIDELPQLLNVLKGDMSMVGPRPPVRSEYEKYAPDHLRRLDVVPGITGLWQVAARKNPSFESYIALDTQYVDNWSVWLDCKILVKTVVVVLAGTGQ